MQIVQVMSSVADVKTSNMIQPLDWGLAPRMLQRTIADNLSSALSDSALPVFDPTTCFPTGSQVRWFWVVMVVDEASSNQRLQAHFDTLMLSLSRSGSRALFCRFPCVVHILHVVPLLESSNLVCDL